MSWVNNLRNWQRFKDSHEYMNQVYGDPNAYLKEPYKTQFVTDREYWGNFGYGECFNSTSTQVQCEIIQGDFDPSTLPYEKRMAWHFREFCYKTSAHGIPMIGQAPNKYYRTIWIILFCSCMIMLYKNAESVLEKYNKNEKIVDIELKFDTAPFPAITLCNLNPYKASVAKSIDLVARTFSFGLRLRKMTRLPAPYGDCITDGKTKDYVYNEYEYTVEGCYRSCFQQLVLKDCLCGDPRFPVPDDAKHCQATDPIARKCLDEKLKELGGVHGSFRCRCQQPCKQSIYSVTYSAAKWPSLSLQIQLGACVGTNEECNKHYKENGAMVEVFYEQLNYEMLTESEAYGFVNLLADFGGQLGLWCGVSFLTCFEILDFLFHTICLFTRHNFERIKKKFVKEKKDSF
uniref:Acid-sensing ion channel 5 n=1 Tax=Parastrongyloides trichosuri TaxID=131310 RepID=A0A0N4ZIN7_PARTI